MMRNGSKWAIGGWLVGGAAWVATGLVGLDAVNGSRGFYVTEVAWLAIHTLVLVGLVGLVRSCPPGETLSRRGFTVAIAGRVVFLVAEIVAIAVVDDEIALFPLAAILSAVGMIAGGVGILRSHRWDGWERFAPLAMGVYPFIAMFPLVAITGERPNTSVALWGITITAVGVAMWVGNARARVPVSSGAPAQAAYQGELQ
jgi:hypothetical protein